MISFDIIFNIILSLILTFVILTEKKQKEIDRKIVVKHGRKEEIGL